MPIPLGILAVAGAGAATLPSDYELLETTLVGTAVASITFSNLNNYSSYRHLQIRFLARGTSDNTSNFIYSRFNSDTGSNYRGHFFNGNGSTVTSGVQGTIAGLCGVINPSTSAASSFSAGVIDLTHAFSTTKNKVLRTLTGHAGQNRVAIHSSHWRNTAAITSWTLMLDFGNFEVGSRFSLYGLKG